MWSSVYIIIQICVEQYYFIFNRKNIYFMYAYLLCNTKTPCGFMS